MLTTGVDTLTGTANNDTFTANPTTVIDPSNGTVSPVDTLQDLDVINGGAGIDTLNVTLATIVGATPVMTSVENVNVTLKAAATLDLADATGVTTVTIQGSTAAGATGIVDNVGAAALAVKNQNQDASFGGSTATALDLTVKNVNDGAATPGVRVVAVDSAVADTATSLTLNVTDSMIDLDSTNNDAYKTVTVNATGTNTVDLTDVAAVATDLTVAGTGSVDFSNVALTALTDLTVANGGVTVDTTGGALEEVTTGSGADDITAVGSVLTKASLGAGDDELSVVGTAVTGVLKATAVIDLGAGDDTITLAAAPAKGATIAGGTGTDTIVMSVADYGTVSTTYTTAERAKISGFEVLGFSDELADTKTYSLSTFTGITSAVLQQGIENSGTATLTNIGANATIEIAGTLDTDATTPANGTGDGELVGTLKADTSADNVTLILNADYTDDNTATAAVAKATYTATVSLAQVENITIDAIGNDLAAPFTPVAGYKADFVDYTAVLDGSDELETLTITGNQKVTFASTVDMTSLTTIDASANTRGVTIDVSKAANDGTAELITIIGSSAADKITGSKNADTITVGAGNDIVESSLGADSITFGAGIDTYKLVAEDNSTLAKMDTITGFTANTIGQGTNGAATSAGADKTDLTLLNGDLIDLSAFGGTSIDVLVVTNAANAQTFIANNANAAVANKFDIAAAFDSSSSQLYLDIDANGVIDSVIELAGVTTIDEAAFVI